MATVRATLVASQPRPITVQLHGWGDGSGVGYLPTLMPRVDRFHRPGQAGSGRQLSGSESPERTVPIVVWCATQAIALATIENLELLAGYPVRLSDPWGRSLTIQVDRVDVRPRRVKGPPVSSGVVATYRVEGTLMVERIE